ncbi:MAG: single-stranded DNA-binding protein [Clostridia bacterium]|nr:single-stranded DNA-binding protein [Clostridia bacterium]
MNKVFLIGNLTRDPELTETSGGIKICRFAIAVNRRNAGGEATDFYNCTAWRGLGETVARYARKGNKVAVSGSIELRNYEDSQGIKRTGIDIIAQDVEFLTPRSNNGGDDFEPAPSNNGSRKPQLQPFDDDSDIPF